MSLSLILLLTAGSYFIVGSVRGLAESTRLPENGPVSVDSGRMAWKVTPYGYHYFYIWDFGTDTYTITYGPTELTSDPVLAGNRIVAASYLINRKGWGLYYCNAAFTPPLDTYAHKCYKDSDPAALTPRWTLISYVDAGVDLRLSTPGIAAAGDIAVWARIGGFAYYRFSTGTITNVTLPVSPRVETMPCPLPCWVAPIGKVVEIGLSTNGAVIAFTAKATPTSPSHTAMYYDTTAAVPAIVDTGLPAADCPCSAADAGYISIAQNTIVFQDNSTSPSTRIRYYDILSDQSSPQGAGPIGYIVSGQSVWDNLIVFVIHEDEVGYDCNRNGTISGHPEHCLRYWYLPDDVLLAPSATVEEAYFEHSAAHLVFPLAVWNGIIAYPKTEPSVYSDARMYYIEFPMQGDASSDGIVNFLDLGILGSAFLSTPDAPNWNPRADFNTDGAVNFVDLGILSQCMFQVIGGAAC